MNKVITIDKGTNMKEYLEGRSKVLSSYLDSIKLSKEGSNIIEEVSLLGGFDDYEDKTFTGYSLTNSIYFYI